MDCKKVMVMISPASAQRLGGIARYAREHSWRLMIQDRMSDRPLAWEGDGVITALRSDESTVKTVKALMKRGVAAVDVTISRPEIRIPRVISDHGQLGRIAAEHFRERNFEHFAWFSTGWGNVQALRLEGFSQTIHPMRLVATEALARRSRSNYQAFFKWLGEELSRAPKPLAVLAYDESDASRLLEVADICGFSVPEEIAVLSIGNDPVMCENQSTPLSSIDQNLELGGYEAAALLDRIMRGEPPPDKPVFIPSRGIVLRRSTDVVASSDPLVKRTLAYIADNLSRSFGAAQIAAALNAPCKELERRFKHELSRSIAEEIRRQRLARAKRLLANPNLTLACVAKEAGFSSASHLVNFFKSSLDCTPAEWRNSISRATGK